MSSDISDVLGAIQDFISLTYVETSVLGMFVYDYILTLSREVDLVWKEKFGLPTVLFIMTRYFVVLGIVYNVAGSPDQPLNPAETTSSCNSLQHLIDSLDIFARGAILAVCIARTYALHQDKHTILLGLGAAGLAILAVDAVLARNGSCTASLDPTSHAIRLSDDVPVSDTVNVTRSVLLQGFDLAVMGLTLYKTTWAWKFQRDTEFRQRKSITTLLLRDGTVYFFALFVTELLNTCLSFLESDTLKEVATAYTLPLQSILTSRFLLDLRYMTRYPNVTDIPLTLTSFHIEAPDAPAPNRIVQSFGGPVYQDTLVDEAMSNEYHDREGSKLDDVGAENAHVIRPEGGNEPEVIELVEITENILAEPVAA